MEPPKTRTNAVIAMAFILWHTSEHTNYSLRARADEGVEVEWLKIILNKSGAVILVLQLVRQRKFYCKGKEE